MLRVRVLAMVLHAGMEALAATSPTYGAGAVRLGRRGEHVGTARDVCTTK